jgi:hypothetical protein
MLGGVVGTVAHAQDLPVAAPVAFEVVRMGDSNLSCEALIAEMNTLNQQMLAMQQTLMTAGQEFSRDAMQASRQRPGGGLATSLGGLAASFIPGGGMVMGAVQAAQQQSAASSMRAQQDSMQQRIQAVTEGAAMMGPISQRVDHLGEIARDHSC